MNGPLAVLLVNYKVLYSKKRALQISVDQFFPSSFPFDEHDCDLTFGSDAVSNSYGFDLLKPMISYKAMIF